MAKTAFFILLFLLFPALLFLNIWQSLEYQAITRELRILQEEQVQLVELNKRTLAALAVYSSPTRIGALAAEDEGLKQVDVEDVILLSRGGP